MGLSLRVNALLRNAKTEERRVAIRDAAKRLVDQAGMGRQYQVMGITNVDSDTGKQASGDVWSFVSLPDGGGASRKP